MRVDVTFSRRIRRSVCLVWGPVLLFLAACASATPQPAAISTPPLVGVTVTTAPSAVPTNTAVPSPTLPAPTASPQPSPTLIASAIPAASATPKAAATVAPPSATAPALTSTPLSPTARPTAAAVDYTPQQVSVWNTALAGTDNMQGTCSNPVNPVYGLVQITPQGNTLVWKNQEPAPYTLSRVLANMWQYSGPTSIGDGTVTMVVQFTSATTLQLTRTFVSTAEPNCTHVHHYTGDFQWNR